MEPDDVLALMVLVGILRELGEREHHLHVHITGAKVAFDKYRDSDEEVKKEVDAKVVKWYESHLADCTTTLEVMDLAQSVDSRWIYRTTGGALSVEITCSKIRPMDFRDVGKFDDVIAIGPLRELFSEIGRPRSRLHLFHGFNWKMSFENLHVFDLPKDTGNVDTGEMAAAKYITVDERTLAPAEEEIAKATGFCEDQIFVTDKNFLPLQNVSAKYLRKVVVPREVKKIMNVFDSKLVDIFPANIVGCNKLDNAQAFVLEHVLDSDNLLNRKPFTVVDDSGKTRIKKFPALINNVIVQKYGLKMGDYVELLDAAYALQGDAGNEAAMGALEAGKEALKQDMLKNEGSAGIAPGWADTMAVFSFFCAVEHKEPPSDFHKKFVAMDEERMGEFLQGNLKFLAGTTGNVDAGIKNAADMFGGGRASLWPWIAQGLAVISVCAFVRR